MNSKLLNTQLVEVDKVVLESGFLIKENLSPNLKLWHAVYILAVAMFHMLTLLIKENEKHE